MKFYYFDVRKAGLQLLGLEHRQDSDIWFRFEQVRVERLTKFSTYLDSEHIRNNEYLINLDSYHASSGIPSLELETLGCLP